MPEVKLLIDDDDDVGDVGGGDAVMIQTVTSLPMCVCVCLPNK